MRLRFYSIFIISVDKITRIIRKASYHKGAVVEPVVVAPFEEVSVAIGVLQCCVHVVRYAFPV